MYRVTLIKGHMGQGQRSRGSGSKVTWVRVKGHMGQGQSVTLVKVEQYLYTQKKPLNWLHEISYSAQCLARNGRWAHVNVKLHFFFQLPSQI